MRGSPGGTIGLRPWRRFMPTSKELSLDPDNADASIASAGLMWMERRFDEAADVARRLMAARPGFTIGGWLKTQIMRDEACLVSDAAALTAAGLPAVGEARRRYTLRACLTPTGLKESLRLPRKRAFSRGPAPANAVRL